MGETAGKLLGDSVAAVMARDPVLAREVIEADNELDRLEDEHEEQIIQLIALNQPVARDLRLLVAFLRINSSIERVGDLAVNIAHTAVRLADTPAMRPFVDIPRSYELVRSMWEDSIRYFEQVEDRLASELRKRDDAVDRVNQETIVQLIDIGREHSGQVFQATNYIGVSKSLERVADLSVDIADEVVYVRQGIFRHQRSHSQHRDSA
jgi:phosphate transport system protein